MLDHLRSDHFRALLGHSFAVHWGGAAPLALTLDSVTEMGRASRAPEATRDPFSLLFRSPLHDRYLIQRIYRVEHPALGALELFLVPLGPDAQGMRYEAIFT